MRLLGDSDLHRPINNSDGRPLGLPSDSGPAHKYPKTGYTRRETWVYRGNSAGNRVENGRGQINGQTWQNHTFV